MNELSEKGIDTASRRNRRPLNMFDSLELLSGTVQELADEVADLCAYIDALSSMLELEEEEKRA